MHAQVRVHPRNTRLFHRTRERREPAIGTPLKRIGAPERAVQYYRASTVVLALDGYNDTAMLSGGNAQTHTPFPAGVDRALLDCLNYTIGESAPMFSDAAVQSAGVPAAGVVPHAVVLLGPLYVLLCLLRIF